MEIGEMLNDDEDDEDYDMDTTKDATKVVSLKVHYTLFFAHFSYLYIFKQCLRSDS